MRAHSTVDRRFVLLPPDFGLEGERACLVITGEVDTLLRERGCRGVMGAELVRRRCLFVAVLTRSPSWVGRRLGVDGTLDGCGFAASPRARRAAFTTWVANAALSFVESPFLSATLVFVVFFDSAFGTAAGFALDLEVFVAAGWEVGVVVVVAVVFWASSLGNSRPLSKAVMAGEHVATEETALRTASAWARGVSMKKSNGLIPNHVMAYCTVSGMYGSIQKTRQVATERCVLEISCL